MRRRTITRVLLAAAIFAAPSLANAQRHHGRHHPAGGTGDQGAAPAGGAPAGGDAGGGSMTFTTDEASQTATPPDPGAAGGDTTAPAGGDTTAPAGGDAGGAGLEGIGGADVRAQAHPIHENIWAVQQIYALRNRRFELQPNAGVSLNDPYVTHYGAGLNANYWVTNVLAVGASFMWFQGLDSTSDIDFHVARSTQLVVPINQYQLSTALNFTYVPLYGKFLMFNRFIFHWDLYLVAGVGVMRTRPIPQIDPEVRSFDYDWRIMFNAGVGLRVFVNRWFGIFGEVRNYIYQEQLEAPGIAANDVPVAPGGMPVSMSRQDPSTWTGSTPITDNVMIQVGLTFFLPTSVTYHLLK